MSFGCPSGVQPRLELLGCIFLCAQAHKLELLLCIILVAQAGCNRDWRCNKNWGSPLRKLGQDESPADHLSGDSLCPNFCFGLPQFSYRFAPIFVSVCPNFCYWFAPIFVMVCPNFFIVLPRFFFEFVFEFVPEFMPQFSKTNLWSKTKWKRIGHKLGHKFKNKFENKSGQINKKNGANHYKNWGKPIKKIGANRYKNWGNPIQKLGQTDTEIGAQRVTTGMVGGTFVLLQFAARQPRSRQSKVREKSFFTAIVKSLIKHDATWRHPCRNAAKQISKNGTRCYETIWRRTLNNTKRYEQEKKKHNHIVAETKLP